MVKIVLTPILPRAFRTKQYLKLVKQAVADEMAIQERLYQKTVRTWQEKPKFVKEGPKLVGFNVIGRIRPDKRSKAGDVFKFLDAGTRVRWAVMSKDFKPKTKTRVIGSSKGRGGAIVMGKRAMQKRGIAPRPGIKARKFTDEIQKRRKKPFALKAQRAITKANQKVFP